MSPNYTAWKKTYYNKKKKHCRTYQLKKSHTAWQIKHSQNSRLKKKHTDKENNTELRGYGEYTLCDIVNTTNLNDWTLT